MAKAIEVDDARQRVLARVSATPVEEVGLGEALGRRLAVDAVLCKADTSDKNPRFQSVVAGTAAPKLGALEVLMFVGDNIQDFPALDQTANTDAKLSEFGSRFFMMPNPMYGSWEKNAQN